MEDRELIEKFLSGGGDEAFGSLFEKYYPEALRTAYLISGSKCDSEYIVQDAFIICYEKLSKLKDPDKFRYWFFRILTREAWRQCKKIKREQPVEQVFDSAQVSDDKSAFEILAEQETASVVRTAIDKLDAKQKTAVVLYYYKEFSVGEIAEIMRCSQGTVKSRLYAARRNIGKELTLMNERSFDNDLQRS